MGEYRFYTYKGWNKVGANVPGGNLSGQTSVGELCQWGKWRSTNKCLKSHSQILSSLLSWCGKKVLWHCPWMRRRQGELAARQSGPSVEFLPDPRGTSLFGKKLFFIKFLLSKWSFCSSSSRILQYKDRRCEPTKKPKGQQAYEGKR